MLHRNSKPVSVAHLATEQRSKTATGTHKMVGQIQLGGGGGGGKKQRGGGGKNSEKKKVKKKR